MDISDPLAPTSDQLERWRAIPGYEGSYEVSDLGRVRSLDRITRDGKRVRGCVLKPFTMPSGHLRVGLSHGPGQTKKVHRLVLEAFVGPCPPEMEALHRNGVPADCRLANLRWGTKSENARDQIAHGRHPMASKTHCPAGHAYSAENTYVRPGTSHRRCRTCTRDNQRAAYQRRSPSRKAA